MEFQKLHRDFYLQPTVTVAQQLLNKLFVRKLHDNYLIGRIVETEAYLHNDPASHSFRGKTLRNSVMFNPGGFLYVYFIYGMYFCCNVVTEEEGKGCAVLLRGIEPVCGIDLMMKNRKKRDTLFLKKNLTNGPGKICQAFTISREENGTDLTNNEIFISENIFTTDNIRQPKIKASTRIGLRIGKGEKKKWRFYLSGNINTP
jgi:DNA-3-methyladenine glycosylase